MENICLCINFTPVPVVPHVPHVPQVPHTTTTHTISFILLKNISACIRVGVIVLTKQKQHMMENQIKIQSTVHPEEQLSHEEWKQQYNPGARLKSEPRKINYAPLETYLQHMENQFQLLNQFQTR